MRKPKIQIFWLFLYFFLLTTPAVSLSLLIPLLPIFWLIFMANQLKKNAFNKVFFSLFLLCFMGGLFHKAFMGSGSKPLVYFLIGRSDEVFSIFFVRNRRLKHFCSFLFAVFVMADSFFRAEEWSLVFCMVLNCFPLDLPCEMEKGFCFTAEVQTFLAEAIQTPFLVLSPNCEEIVHCNEKCMHFFQTDKNEEIFKKISELSLKPLDSAVQIKLSSIPSILKSSTTPSSTFLANLSLSPPPPPLLPSPPRLSFSLTATSVLLKNDVPSIFLSLHDTTPLDVIKQLQKVDSFKDFLFSTVSHDLRLPVNSIIGLIEMAVETVKNSTKTYLETALKSCHFMLFVLNDFLDYAQITDNKLKLNISTQTVNKSLEIILDLIRFQCQQKNINLKLESNFSVYRVINTDHRRLQQILLNILGNSIKFTNSGGSIKLSLDSINVSNREYVKFSVKDTGIGIKSEDFAKLFKEFGKLQQEKPDFNSYGIGLGLLISNNLVKYLCPEGDGEIKVESNFGEGSTFSFMIPVDYNDQEVSDVNEEYLLMKQVYISKCSQSFEKKKLSKPYISELGIAFTPKAEAETPTFFPAHGNRKRKRVLIVDDDQGSIFLLSQYMELFDIEYDVAYDGKRALEKISRNNDLDLIIMDCYMPRLTGFEVSKRIKHLIKSKALNFVPILALSASCSGNDIKKCLENGMDYFLGKPVLIKDMREMLEKIFLKKLEEKKENLEKN